MIGEVLVYMKRVFWWGDECDIWSYSVLSSCEISMIGGFMKVQCLVILDNFCLQLCGYYFLYGVLSWGWVVWIVLVGFSMVFVWLEG